MAFTVSNCLVSALDRMGQLNISKGTGGSTTTIVDTTLDQDTFNEDDAYKNGFAVVIRDAGGASAAPEGEFSRITAFVAGTGTFTLEATLTAAIATGDQYGFTTPQYPLQDMLRMMNEALLSLGQLPLVDTTTLTTVAGATEYAAALPWKSNRPDQIDIQGRTSLTTDNQWRTIFDWEWVAAAPGTTGKIIFNGYPIGSRAVRVFYTDTHATVNAFSDPINERIQPEMAIRALIYQIYTWLMRRDDGSDPVLLQKWNQAKADLAEVGVSWPIEKPRKSPKLLIIQDGQDAVDDRVRAPV